MRYVERFVACWYDFVVGDDWVAAAGAATALAASAGLAQEAPAWWLMPVAVVLLLAASVWRGARAAGQAG